MKIKISVSNCLVWIYLPLQFFLKQHILFDRKMSIAIIVHRTPQTLTNKYELLKLSTKLWPAVGNYGSRDARDRQDRRPMNARKCFRRRDVNIGVSHDVGVKYKRLLFS